jgi:hypothetical protein
MNDMTCVAGDGVLQAYIDGELASPDERLIEQHLSTCPACEEQLAELRDAGHTLTGAVLLLDRPLTGVPEPGRAAAHRRLRGSGWAALPRAAVLVLGFAAAAAAAVPGSPVRGWVESFLDGGPEIAARQAEERVADVEMDAAAEAEPQAGVSVAPEGGAVHVNIDAARPGLVVVAVLSDGRMAGVYATGSAASARFSTAPGRIDVSGAAAGVLQVEIPAATQVATVDLGGSRYIRKEGGVLRLTADGAVTTGTRVSFTVR